MGTWMRSRTGAGALLIALAALVPASVHAATAVGGCQTTGSITFGPGVNMSPKTSAFSLSLALSTCYSVGAATGGTFSVGNIEAEDTGDGTWQWQEPKGSAFGTCADLTGAFTAILRWNDGTVTVASLNLATALPAMGFAGTVVPSVSLAAVDQQDGQPATKTVTTTQFLGGALGGGFFVYPSDFGFSCFGAGETTMPIPGGGLGGGAAI